MNIRFFQLLFLLCIPVLHANNRDLFEGKNILILGGTGYLGRAITHEVLKGNPNRVVIFSRDEVKHFTCLKLFEGHKKLSFAIGDIRDYDSVLAATRNMDIVFHAAALKRMDALESNVQEAVKTNVMASLNVFNACVANNVDKVLFVSTDKASLAINAYGACKFVSEKIFTNYDTTTIKTKFVVTRFGNILESTGSVIPIFTQKILDGHPITLTDSRMSRFIIAKDEAAQLMCDALRYCTGGEIVTKRLPAMNVLDLIEILKDHYDAINPITHIGLRPGEKLHEVLVNEFELKRTYEYKNYLFIRPSIADTTSDFQPEYVTDGIYLADRFEGDYSSDKEVLSRAALTEYFNKLGIFKVVEGRIHEKINI